MKTQIILILSIFTLSHFFIFDSFAQSSGSPFEREFSDVKFLDAYFGTVDEKIEIEPGDKNIPFTIIFANIGTQDITGVIGQLQLSLGFSSSDGPGSLIFADNDGNALAGENFALTFFVNIDNSVEIMQHPGTVKVEYSRLRESGIRNGFFDFNFKVTGDSILNMRPTDRILNSLTINDVVVEVVNDGTAPLSSVDIVLQNTGSTISSTSQSITNVEKVVFTESHWDLGNIEPKSTKYLSFNIYIPQSIKDAPFEGKNILLVKQHRFPHGYILEIPAGTLEKGETPEECAFREIREETGYTAKKMKHLLTYFPSVGYNKEAIHCYVASGLKKSGDLQLDHDEIMSVVKMDFNKLMRMIKAGKIIDSKTICAVLTYAAKKNLL